MEERKYSVTVARFPGNQQEHPASSGYVMNLLPVLNADRRIGAIDLWCKSDTPITMVRNRCVKDALERGADYLLMIDSDMAPDCESGAPPFWETAWDFMMVRREGEIEEGLYPPATICAPYCGPSPKEHVYVFRWLAPSSGDPDKSFRLEMYDRDHAATMTGIEEVAALPTGLILYDMRVFKQLPPPWFDYEWSDEPYRTVKASTEDVFQTRNASIAGMPQYVAWDCWAGHVKLKTVQKPCPLTVHAIRKEYAAAVIRYEARSRKP